jgi:transposase
MRFVGIDIASQKHVVAILSEQGEVLLKPTSFGESQGGYQKLKELLGEPESCLVLLEATGHYWKNLAASLIGWGISLVLLNPLRTRRFAESDLERTKTDAIDALSLARLGKEKRPAPTVLPDDATESLKELVRHRDRIKQDFDDRLRQLHRMLDLVFPEMRPLFYDLGGPLATTILTKYPTAQAIAQVRVKSLANLKYTERGLTVGVKLATELVTLAKVSVGAHPGPVYELQVRHTCEDLDLWRKRLQELERDIGNAVEKNDLAKLLTTIEGVVGPLTSARLLAELGDPARFDSPEALAAYVGVVPALKQSGMARGNKAGLTPIGNARLRTKLYMPVLNGTQVNPWLKYHYERLLAAGKPPKVAITACIRKLLHAVYSVAKSRKPFVPRLPNPALTPTVQATT